MKIEFSGRLRFWRGPARWYFVTVPAGLNRDFKEIEPYVTHGYGMIPVEVHTKRTTYRESLCPKDGRYIVLVTGSVREAEGSEEGDKVKVALMVG